MEPQRLSGVAGSGATPRRIVLVVAACRGSAEVRSMVAEEVGLVAERPIILVVEDEVLIRLMVADELRNAGLHVLEASNADEAWTILESSLRVQFLFTDVHMRGSMDGVELARRARERYPKLTVMLTSSREPEGGFRGIAEFFLGKPYDPRAVVRQVERLAMQCGNDDGKH
jgi:two-component system, response regulator PdtaR